MSYHYHAMTSLDDETKLLKGIIDLETQVRAKREMQRVARNSESERFSRIFEPITGEMKSLQAIANPSQSSSGPATKRLKHEENLMKFNEQLQQPDHLSPIEESVVKQLPEPLLPLSTNDEREMEGIRTR